MPVAHGVVTVGKCVIYIDISYIFFNIHFHVGGIVAAIDHKSDVESAVACIKTVDVKYIVAHPETLDRAIIAAKEVGIPLKSIFVLGEKDIQGTVCVENAFWGNHTEYAVPVKYTVEELETTIAYFYFTSGTTGNKKAVPMT
jgi:acyl-coenzyme A synthetase/AMP-(fatty) acid ligase